MTGKPTTTVRGGDASTELDDQQAGRFRIQTAGPIRTVTLMDDKPATTSQGATGDPEHLLAATLLGHDHPVRLDRVADVRAAAAVLELVVGRDWNVSAQTVVSRSD